MQELMAQKDFVILELAYNTKIILPENMSREKIELENLRICKVGPEVKAVQVGDGVVVAPEAILPFTHEKKLYFLTREDNVGVVRREVALEVPDKV